MSTISASIKTQGQTSMQCAGDEFQCYDGIKCLPRSFRCDKIAQCHDSSDEADCAGTVLFTNMDLSNTAV